MRVNGRLVKAGPLKQPQSRKQASFLDFDRLNPPVDASHQIDKLVYPWHPGSWVAFGDDPLLKTANMALDILEDP
jgi:hypothetical protein